MKKTSTLVLILLACSAVHAQPLQKGTILLGGTLGFSRETVDRTNEEPLKTTMVNLNPSFGKFYRDNRSVGVNLYYSGTRSEEKTKSTYYGMGVFLRQYLPLGKSFYLLAEEGASFRTGKDRSENQSYTITDQTDIALNFYPGVAYSLTKNFQIELALTQLVSLSYKKKTYRQNTGTVPLVSKSNSLILQTGAAESPIGYLAFGFKWLLQ